MQTHRGGDPRVLVAGIGNIFLGDDGFGVEVARRLKDERALDGVDVADFGIRGIHLAYELAEGRYDAAILVDALPRGGPPGTLYAIEPETDENALPLDGTDAHRLTPASVIAWLRRVGGQCSRIVVVGCEPESVEEAMGLSAPVAASVDGAVELICRLVEEMKAPAGAAPAQGLGRSRTRGASCVSPFQVRSSS